MQQAKELLKCYESPMYFARNYIKVYDFVQDRHCNLQISKKHRAVLNSLFRSKDDVFVVGSRQTGVDTTVLVYLLYEIIFNGKSVYIQARNHNHAKILMETMLDYICKFPEEWNIAVNMKRKDRVEFSSGGSIDITSNLLGYRFQPDIVYVADAAYVKKLYDVMQQLQFGTEKSTRWIMANSGAPVDGQFKALWDYYDGEVIRHTIHYSEVEHIELAHYLGNKAHLPIRSWMEQYELYDVSPDQ